MTPDTEPEPDDSTESTAREEDRRRRRRRAEVFGDVLPEQTRDDQVADRVDRSPDGSSEEWLRSQVPPHHG